MRLVDRVIAYEHHTITTQTILEADCIFAEPLGVPGWVGIELMAQTVAAHGALDAGGKIQDGLLLGAREYLCHVPYFPLATLLTISATPDFAGVGDFGLYRCEITAGNQSIAEARLKVFRTDNLATFLESRGLVRQ